MFTLLASTGKLIKITELDMGIVDAAGETILTENLTDEMQQNMSDFYQSLLRNILRLFRWHSNMASLIGARQTALLKTPSGEKDSQLVCGI